MSIIRRAKGKDNPYVMIAKAALRDRRLSWKARGMLGYLLTLPDDWTVRISHLATESDQDGKCAVQSAFQEFATYGYAKLLTERDAKGHVLGSSWEIHEFPVPPTTGDEKICTPVEHRQPDFPADGEPPPLLKTEKREKNQDASLSFSPEEDNDQNDQNDQSPPECCGEPLTCNDQNEPNEPRPPAPQRLLYQGVMLDEDPKLHEHTQAMRTCPLEAAAVAAVVDRLDPVTYQFYEEAAREYLLQHDFKPAYITRVLVRFTMAEIVTRLREAPARDG